MSGTKIPFTLECGSLESPLVAIHVQTTTDQLDDLIQKYNVSGPRYTSYPTALQFESFSPDEHMKAIAASANKDKPLSLYFHLPFCNTLCYYCACNKIVTRKRGPLEEYLGLLNVEMDQLATKFRGREVTQLHWGGGTPTFLDDGQIQTLMKDIRDRFRLCNDADGEFSIEIDPRTVDRQRIKHLRASGFNRLSFGVQDFDETVQKSVNRVQSFEQTEIVIQAGRDYDFKSISIDLIYGLPHQTVVSFAETLDKVLKLSPDRISIYNYAHMPQKFYPQTRILATDLPAPDTKLALLKLCIDTLTSEGYVYIGMDHFAKPDDELAVAQRQGDLHRNFQGYSTRSECDLLAFGITSISQIGNVYCQNVKDLDEYRDRLSRGLSPVTKGVVIDDDDLIRRDIIRSLICQFELDFNRVAGLEGVDFTDYFETELRQLEQMQDDGLLAMDKTSIKVTAVGRLLIRNICMVFDRHLARSGEQSRFSRAI